MFLGYNYSHWSGSLSEIGLLISPFVHSNLYTCRICLGQSLCEITRVIIQYFTAMMPSPNPSILFWQKTLYIYPLIHSQNISKCDFPIFCNILALHNCPCLLRLRIVKMWGERSRSHQAEVTLTTPCLLHYIVCRRLAQAIHTAKDYSNIWCNVIEGGYF